jgi:hypothetical protein
MYLSEQGLLLCFGMPLYVHKSTFCLLYLSGHLVTAINQCPFENQILARQTSDPNSQATSAAAAVDLSVDIFVLRSGAETGGPLRLDRSSMSNLKSCLYTILR